MNRYPTRQVVGRKGCVLILSLLLLVLCASLATALTATTSLELKKSSNLEQASKAQLAAESGLEFFSHALKDVALSAGVEGEAMFAELASSLTQRLNGTANLAGGSVSYSAGRIGVPSIAMDDGMSFEATVSLLDDSTIGLAVTGRCTDGQGTSIRRTLSIEFQTGSESPNLAYGVYSKGPIAIEANFDYRGANSPDEASLYTEASSGFAVQIDQNGYVDGDIDLRHEYGMVSLGNNTVINGDVNVGVPPSVFPEVDPGVFTPFATNVMDGSTPTQNVTLTNLRIPANTNPQFGSNVTLRGVIYIEAPNYVYFKNNVDVVGVIVTDDASETGGTSKIYFKNNLNMSGVENLPDTAEFSELRTLTGSALLAPGFEVEFKNNFTSMSGTLACDQLVLKNNLSATVHGALIIYGDGGLTFKNNAALTIDRSSLAGLPSGLSAPGATIFLINPDTYQEQP